MLLLASEAREWVKAKLCVFQTARYGTILDLDGSSYLDWYGYRPLMLGITNHAALTGAQRFPDR
jgi:hypothetical protein